VTIVVGVPPKDRGRGGVHLAGMLARSAQEDIALCAVVPAPWPPSPARVDAEYRAQLDGAASAALDVASARLPADLSATSAVHHARSVASGLLEVATQHDASFIVVGSSSSGVLGRMSLGSVSDRLLHTSPIPVALAPRGFRCSSRARVARVTAAFGGSDPELVATAAGLAADIGASLRIASFAVRARPPYTSGVGRQADDAMVREWVEQIEAAVQTALAEAEGRRAAPAEIETVVGYAESWDEALEDVEWEADDILVVGSSSVGPIARVFLGARSAKIVRHSPVPVVVLPRGSTAEVGAEVLSAETR
jgi:nucleotide-binding universal stress UspA family protein